MIRIMHTLPHDYKVIKTIPITLFGGKLNHGTWWRIQRTARAQITMFITEIQEIFEMEILTHYLSNIK